MCVACAPKQSTAVLRCSAALQITSFHTVFIKDCMYVMLVSPLLHAGDV